MTEKEQIEQMARITCQMYCRQYEKRCAGVGECDYKCLHYQRCEVLYAAGYHKQPEWISVEDRLPEERGWYWVTLDVNVVNLCFYLEHDGFVLTSEKGLIPIGDRVSYWMPQLIPSPPTEKEN